MLSIKLRILGKVFKTSLVQLAYYEMLVSKSDLFLLSIIICTFGFDKGDNERERLNGRSDRNVSSLSA